MSVNNGDEQDKPGSNSNGGANNLSDPPSTPSHNKDKPGSNSNGGANNQGGSSSTPSHENDKPGSNSNGGANNQGGSSSTPSHENDKPGSNSNGGANNQGGSSSTPSHENEKEGKQEKNPENKDDSKSDNTRDNETKIKVITQSKGTMKIVFNIEPEKKLYYHTCSCKRGLLCIVQINPNWKDGNKKDSSVLKGFFEKTLGFDVEEFSTYGALEAVLDPPSDPASNQEKKNSLYLENYYCLLICISSHGDKKGVIIEDKEKCGTCDGEYVTQWKTIDDIKTRFGNEKISKLAGVPKIIILDVCRGDGQNTAVKQEPNDKKDFTKENQVLPTKSSDLLLIHATTHGHIASIPPEEGSVGIQSIVKVLNKNWKNDHLEEMLIDARMEVAKWEHKEKEGLRQTLETESTLTKRLMFVESSKKKQDVPPAELSSEKE